MTRYAGFPGPGATHESFCSGKSGRRFVVFPVLLVFLLLATIPKPLQGASTERVNLARRVLDRLSVLTLMNDDLD